MRSFVPRRKPSLVMALVGGLSLIVSLAVLAGWRDLPDFGTSWLLPMLLIGAGVLVAGGLRPTRRR